jgi:uncharacterized Fe-S radical SAM superfamily protein PflX
MKEPVFLRRYQQVEKNELPPRYKDMPFGPVYFEKAASLEELWAMHQVKMQDYRKLWHRSILMDMTLPQYAKIFSP